MSSGNARGDALKPPVLLVHGIRPNRDWQTLISQSLGHFFRPVIVTYPQYDAWYAFLLVFCEPAFVLVGGLLAVALWTAGVPEWVTWLTALVGLLLAIMPAIADRRRVAALRAYQKAAGDVLHSEPHVIAHSFGTYLTARLLTEIKGQALQRIVLCGAVLDRDFDWQALIAQQKVKQVRNDYTAHDRIGWAGGTAALLVRLLGSVGKSGMGDRLAWVHRLQRPQDSCPSCLQASCEGTVHDVDCSVLGHSDLFLSPAHCRQYWLPFLWGIDPGEHRRLLTVCRQWVEAVRALDRKRVAEIERILHSCDWGWCCQQTVWQVLEHALQIKGLPVNDERVAEAFSRLAHSMHHATLCDFAASEARFLHPIIAVNQAVAGLARPTS